ncbi:MAG: hypothetical protein IIC52_05570 [Proteobacteria bacterium]|nr:hypothetical protein [Pseudomonadota bacterium]
MANGIHFDGVDDKAYYLSEDGIDLNGITLQSSVLDYPANFSNAAGLMPTFAADAWFHKKTGIEPQPPDLASFMETVTQFAQGPYTQALQAFPKADSAAVETLRRYLGLPAGMLGTVYYYSPDLRWLAVDGMGGLPTVLVYNFRRAGADPIGRAGPARSVAIVRRVGAG